jgi:hypothetical protein
VLAGLKLTEPTIARAPSASSMLPCRRWCLSRRTCTPRSSSMRRPPVSVVISLASMRCTAWATSCSDTPLRTARAKRSIITGSC